MMRHRRVGEDNAVCTAILVSSRRLDLVVHQASQEDFLFVTTHTELQVYHKPRIWSSQFELVKSGGFVAG
jgi:hypothetical protein